MLFDHKLEALTSPLRTRHTQASPDRGILEKSYGVLRKRPLPISAPDIEQNESWMASCDASADSIWIAHAVSFVKVAIRSDYDKLTVGAWCSAMMHCGWRWFDDFYPLTVPAPP
jgi:hypothetical protein